MEPNTDWSAALNDLQKAMATRRKAELDVIAAARKFLGITYDTGRPVDFQFMTEWISVAIEIKNAVRALDALESEPPLDAEPELPPRHAEWRGLMARVDHGGGC